MPNGATAKARVNAKMYHKLREPAISVDMVPSFKNNVLIIANKFEGSKYITILTEDDVNIHNGKTKNITISEEAVLRWWRCNDTGLWRIQLNNPVKN